MAVAYETRSNGGPASPGESLFTAYQARVLRTAYRITGNMSDAEDVAQSVFLRVLNGPTAEVVNPESYLCRAAINGALDLIRRRAAAREAPLELVDPVVGRGSPDDVLSTREIRTWLRRALARLSPRAAEMFVLRYLEDRGNREIASITGTSAAVVAVTLYHTRSKLRRQFQLYMRGR